MSKLDTYSSLLCKYWSAIKKFREKSDATNTNQDKVQEQKFKFSIFHGVFHYDWWFMQWDQRCGNKTVG